LSFLERVAEEENLRRSSPRLLLNCV